MRLSNPEITLRRGECDRAVKRVTFKEILGVSKNMKDTYDKTLIFQATIAWNVVIKDVEKNRLFLDMITSTGSTSAARKEGI